MAITATQIQFRNDGRVMISGKLNNLFGNVYTNGSTQYEWVEVWMLNPDLTLSTVKAWLTLDARGGSIAIGYDSTSGVIGRSVSFDAVDITTLTYSSPTSKATGLTLGNMAPDTKLRLGVRRILTNSTPASPESNRLWVGGTSPI